MGYYTTVEASVYVSTKTNSFEMMQKKIETIKGMEHCFFLNNEGKLMASGEQWYGKFYEMDALAALLEKCGATGDLLCMGEDGECWGYKFNGCKKMTRMEKVWKEVKV